MIKKIYTIKVFFILLFLVLSSITIARAVVIDTPENLTVGSSSWQNSPDFSVNWDNATTSYPIFWYKLDSAPTKNSDGTSTTTKPFTISATQTGGQTLYVWLEDSQGDKDYAKYSTTTLNYTTSPLSPISLTANGSTATSSTTTNEFLIDWTNGGSINPIAAYWYKLGSEPTTDEDGTSTTTKPFTISTTQTGGQTLYIWLQDDQGNKNYILNSSINLNYTINVPAPTSLTANGSTATSSTTTNEFLIDWTNASSTNPITAYWYKLGSEPTNNTDGATTTKPFTVTATQINGQDLYVWLQDDQGNADYNNYASVNLNYILESPTNLTANGINPSSLQASSTFSIDWDNATTTYSTFWYQLGETPTSTQSGTSTTTKPFNIDATQTDNQDLYVWFQDAQGNIYSY